MRRDGRDGDTGALADPQADLFFTLAAVMLPAILLLLPAARMAGDTPARQVHAFAAEVTRAGATVRGERAAVFLAQADGIAFAQGERHSPLDAVVDDPALQAALVDARIAGRPVLLLIEPDGQEAAFLFEAVAAGHGPGLLAQARLGPDCSMVDSTCRSGEFTP